jgi:uncharacterized protein
MLLLTFVLLLQSQLPSQRDEAADVALARRTIERLAKGEFAAVEETFSAKLRAALPEDKLRATWQRLYAKTGRLKGCGEAKTKDRRPLRGVVIPTAFEKRTIKIEVVFNAAGEIAGLLFG